MTQNSLTANTCREIDAEPSPCEHLGDLTDLKVAGFEKNHDNHKKWYGKEIQFSWSYTENILSPK